MTRLVEALEALGVDARVAPSGRWAELDGDRCQVFVTAAPGEADFYVWCDDARERVVEHHADPVAAVRSGLRRATRSHGSPPPAS